MNSVNVIGRLTKTNEPKQYNSQNGGGLMLKNTIAIKGKKKDESYFVDFTAWGKTAEYLAQYSNKGDKIALIFLFAFYSNCIFKHKPTAVLAIILLWLICLC